MRLQSDHKISSARRNTRAEKANEPSNEILFMCPELDVGVYPKNVWKEKIIAYIANKRALDRVRACVVAIKTFNSENEIVYSLRILRIYVSNLIEHSCEQKFRKIRLGNPYMEKLRDVVGGFDFLHSIGFEERRSEKDELYLVFVDKGKLKLPEVLEELDSVKGFTLSLFRNVIFIKPSTDPVPEEPDDFYDWTIEDMGREYQYRKNKSEIDQQLRTKKMREEAVNVNSDYAIIRVKFPDGLIIQATFSTKETLADLKMLLKKNMELSQSFYFVLPPSKKFTEVQEYTTFLELNLFPSVMLLVRWRLG